MKAEKPACLPENIKFTEENSKVTYKQQQDLKMHSQNRPTLKSYTKDMTMYIKSGKVHKG